MNKVRIICGPTGSGKSAVAHKLATIQARAIINADAMQVYRQLPILTASPSRNMLSEVDYYGYNFLSVDEGFSAGLFASYASLLLGKLCYKGKVPLIVGGSGMYISYLVNGYNSLPEAQKEHRLRATEMQETLGNEGLYQKLIAIDPNYEGNIDTSNKQRLIRAYEVYLQTDKSLLQLQQQAKIQPLAGYEVELILLLPERSFLRQICRNRLRDIFTSGAIEEVEAIDSQLDSFSQSAQKIIGLAEIHAYLQGRITKDEAFEATLNRTMQYAKRQSTFFRHQFSNIQKYEYSSHDEYNDIAAALALLNTEHN